MYAEETDFCLRAWSKGYASVVDTNLIVFHKVAASSSNNSGFKLYYQTRNLYYLLNKNKELIGDYRYFIWKYFFDVLKNLLKIVINNKQDHKIKKMKAIVKAVYASVIKKKYGCSFK